MFLSDDKQADIIEGRVLTSWLLFVLFLVFLLLSHLESWDRCGT